MAKIPHTHVDLTVEDMKTLLLISALTMASLVLILTLPAVTAYEIRARDVLMVIGWFFGATMTFAWVKRARDRK